MCTGCMLRWVKTLKAKTEDDHLYGVTNCPYCRQKMWINVSEWLYMHDLLNKAKGYKSMSLKRHSANVDQNLEKLYSTGLKRDIDFNFVYDDEASE